MDSPDILTFCEIKTNIIGKKIWHFNETESTNTIAWQIANFVDEGTVIIAETQTQGRGRMGNKWLSPLGGIWLSVILKPKMQPFYAPRITLLAGVAVAKTIKSYGIEAGIKWPNDVLINGKKVCGILTEISAETDLIKYVVVGIGIDANVVPDEFKETSTSLKNELGYKINRVEFVQRLFKEFEELYIEIEKNGFSSIFTEWKNMSVTIGKYVKITTYNRILYGMAIGIDEEGRLVIKTDNGEIEKIISGNCEHI